jgi:hypothetical protein
MKRKILTLAFLTLLFMLALPLAAAAQTTTGITIDPKILEALAKLSFIPLGGLTLTGLTELVKRWIWPKEETRPKWSGYVVSIILSFAATAAYFTFVVHPFIFITFLIYGALTALAANGLYKAF